LFPTLALTRLEGLTGVRVRSAERARMRTTSPHEDHTKIRRDEDDPSSDKKTVPP
jgi:hypothetical protein